MEGLIFLLVMLVFAAVIIVPLVTLVRISGLQRRVAWLERELAHVAAARPHADPAPTEHGVPEPTLPHQAPAAVTMAPAPTATPAIPAAPSTPATAATPREAPIRTPSPAPAVSPTLTAAARPLDASGLEQLVGAVWLQHVGAVMVLLGVFLMIVWGYTTGRFGPEVLVVGGVGFGLALAWRGASIARGTPRLGHTLIGVGLGVMYTTLYLGYTQLRVLGPWLALALLVVVSLGAVVVGLRLRVQVVALFGVIGAFLPQFMARWLGMPGFEVTPVFLLAYLAAIDSLVFVLAARAGWSALDVMAIALSAFTWMAAFATPVWGWGAQIGLSALFTVLGLAPLPRLSRVEGRLRPIDLAVVAAAPLALLAASAPFLTYADRGAVAMLLFSLAAVMLAAALWVDLRRPERDLWVPLTAAATLFLTAALERSLGPVYTALAWAVEGVVLLVLGLRERGGWLRAMGHAVLLLGALALLSRLFDSGTHSGAIALFHGSALRDLLCIAALLVAGGLLSRGRARLGAMESLMPELWTVAGHGLLAIWLAIECDHLARALTASGAPLQLLGVLPDSPLADRRAPLAGALMVGAWLTQSAVLAWRGTRGSGLLRFASAVLGLLALFGSLVLADSGPSVGARIVPFVHAASLLQLGAVALMVAIALRHAAHCELLPRSERRSAEAWATGASLLLMIWSVRETHLLAALLLRGEALPGTAGHTGAAAGESALAASLASLAWLLQAIAVLVVGMRRESAFLRWSGLTLLGLTLAKFLLLDLQNVDVFWRFLTAILAGAAMLGFSYVYQRRTRAGTQQGDS